MLRIKRHLSCPASGRAPLLVRFRRGRDGLAATGFALMAPFVFLLAATVETSLAYGAFYMLEGGVADAGQVMRTQRAREGGDLRGAFEIRLCEMTAALINCDDIAYEAVAMEPASVLAASGGGISGRVFAPGAPGQTVLIRATYQYRPVLPFVATLLPSSGRFTSTYVVQNETVSE